MASKEVCTGLVTRFGPTVHYILTSRLELTANIFCGIVLQAQGCASVNLLTEWNIDLSDPNPRPEVRRHGPRTRAISRSSSIVFDDQILPVIKS